MTYEVPELPAEIEGRKWLDQNVNGVRDGNEPWLNGWTIELYDVATGQLVDSMVTGNRDLNDDGQIDPTSEVGWYSFTTVPGTWEVREVMQAGWAQSYPGFAADFGKRDSVSASGGLSLSETVLNFDFDVDNPRGVRLALDFFVPAANGGRRRVTSRPGSGPAGEGRLAGSVLLTPSEIASLIRGEMTVGLVNTRGKVKAEGPVQATGAHIVSLSSGEVVTGRNFGNYRPGETTDGPILPLPVDLSRYAAQGIHFVSAEPGVIAILIAPQNVRHVVVASADPGFSVVATKPTARQVATMLTFAARREPSIAAALDRMFGSEDLLEILG